MDKPATHRDVRIAVTIIFVFLTLYVFGIGAKLQSIERQLQPCTQGQQR